MSEPDMTESQVLMLGLAEEIFAVDAGLVREIIDPITPTRVAGAPRHLPAVVNVRGNVIPLADLRVRFGAPAADPTADSRIVVIELPIDDDLVTVGVVADKVYEVTEITAAGEQPIPKIGMKVQPAFIRSIVKWNGKFVIVPDLKAILS